MKIGNYEIKPGVDLNNADLSHQDLQYVNLQGANLQNANLEGCNLRGSNLRFAKLENANLKNANLDNTDVQGANFQSANLDGASVRNMASSMETNFLGTIFDSNNQKPSGEMNQTFNELQNKVNELQKYKEFYDNLKSLMNL